MCNPRKHPDSAAVAGAHFQLAQVNRYVRFVRLGGREADLRSICDSVNRIRPERPDFDAVRCA